MNSKSPVRRVQDRSSQPARRIVAGGGNRRSRRRERATGAPWTSTSSPGSTVDAAIEADVRVQALEGVRHFDGARDVFLAWGEER